MSKVKRFSLEERYGYQNRKVIYDKTSDNDIELNNIYPIIDLFNQLDEQISDLQHKLEVAEIATKLACERVKYFEEMQDREMGFEDLFGYESNYDLQGIIKQYKEQAEKEIAKLKQQLEEKDKIEYTDTINFVETSEPDIVAKELDRLNEQLAEKEKKLETLQTHFKKTQELLAREMGNSNIVIDNLQKEMKQALANQKDYYEKRLKFIAEDIVEKIKGRFLATCRIKQGNDEMIASFQTFNRCLDTILKEYQK